MKKILITSLVLNAVLGAGVTLIWTQRQHFFTASSRPVQSVIQSSDISAPPVRVTPIVEKISFNWSQLNARDYHDYVKNLRTIGCPEPTVRAIVTADVRGAYGVQINAWKKSLADRDKGSWVDQVGGTSTEADLKAKLENAPEAEAAEIADLLGLKPAPDTSSVANDSTSHPQHHRNQAQDLPVSVPLVLQDIDPTVLASLNLTEEQKQAIADVRQQFIDQIGGANQDPNDPAYLERWREAQPLADNMLKLDLGPATWYQYANSMADPSLTVVDGSSVSPSP